MNSDFSKALSSVLQKNIVCGDALTLTDKERKAIVFPEWSFVNGNKIKRRDYTFDSLLNSSTEQPTFETQENLDSDPNCKDMAIPTPIREYPLMDFLRTGSGFVYSQHKFSLAQSIDELISSIDEIHSRAVLRNL
ncbi:hypothetical protein [Scardovia inopinata]|nr:hypothetical protein [Scardovia inopinata]